MNYYQVTIATGDDPIKEILIALLTDEGYEGFEENENGLLAFIPAPDYDEARLKEVIGAFGLASEVAIIEKRNWNTDWERNFSPVVVEGFCTVRADFHALDVTTPYEIIITPKMSFGTGHHATTQLMMTMMKAMDFNGRRVLDFGTGTGILAILADKMGAASVLGIDNDDWSYENAVENAGRNDAANVKLTLGTLDLAAGQSFDILLANINRHILLQYMSDLSAQLVDSGQLLLSGLLMEDRDIIIESASGFNLSLTKEDERNGWIVLQFNRKARP